LFKIHLMAQVVRNDLATGRLLALESDVPELVKATNEAQDAMRRMIGGLQSSPLGATGLKGTLEMLCDELGTETNCRIVTNLHESDAAPVVQLLMYQVAREALRNALRYASATRIDVLVDADNEFIRLVVADNGIGFLPSLVDRGEHFGLQLIRERVELLGGTLVVESVPGRGTTIVGRMPLRPDEH
jgi:signal transduction histidine kinase